MQYDDNPESIEDPTYGTLQAYYKTWGLDNQNVVRWEQLQTRKCTKEELNIAEENNGGGNFYEPDENSRRDLTIYYKKLKCLE